MKKDKPEAVIAGGADRQVGELGNPPGKEPTDIQRRREACPLVPERRVERVATRLFVRNGRSPVRDPERAAEDSRIWQLPSDHRRVIAQRSRAREHVRLSAPRSSLSVAERE